LLCFLRLVLVTVVGVAVLPSRGGAQDLTAAQRQAALAALTAAESGEWSQAFARAEQVKDPLPLKMVRWLEYTHGNTAARFAEIAAFIENNPDWPYQKTLYRRAEDALQFESDEIASAWFKRHPAVSAAGKVREAEIMLNRGQRGRATAALRAAWIGGNFTPLEERGFWSRHGGQMRAEDNRKRLDRLLWDKQIEAARRMLPRVATDYRALGEARIALATGARYPEKLVAQVPAPLRSDSGLVFAQLRWDRKKDMVDAAARILLAQSGDPVHPAAWWAERQLIARRVLAAGNAAEAYKIVEQHGKLEGAAFSEAEFLSGYIALRYLKKPDLAFDDFSHILARVSSPSAKARAAYWGGRAAAAEGKADLATKWFAAGAEHMTTFYGQLAAHHLGSDAPPHPIPEPRPTADQSARFNAQELVRAARLLLEAGGRDHYAKAFLMRMAEKAKTPLDYAMLANLAEEHGRIDLAIAVARRAGHAGMPLMVHGYPVTALPKGGTTERPLLLAIVRQESGFETDAVSRAGARGLMQLMPATAASIASKMQLPYSTERLTADGIYNVLLGRTYLETLLDDFGGSYALAIAAYNAGPGRVRQWLHEFGDPRGHGIDMVDWIEMIPFTETRTYVQRVLENLQIYRMQSGNEATAFSLVSDLAR
jgi:peptidoglycan lytic transglycosylase